MKKTITIYHNPRCSKSRETLQLLRDNGIEPQIVEYLKDTPDEEELRKLLMKLHLRPTDILRTGEALYKQKLKGLKLTDEEWIRVMVENPSLIERPIVVKGHKAVLGRPPENVLELL